MTGLVEFLTARLDEDEGIALASAPGPWRLGDDGDVIAVDGITVAEGFALSGNQLRATVDHIARHDPARVLRQVAAGRALLARYERAVRSQNDRPTAHRYRRALYDALVDLAQTYSDHDEYDPGWAPVST